MSEIHMLVRVVAQEDSVDALVAGMKELRDASRAEEGVLRYDIVRDIESPLTFYIQESYRDKDSFKSHARSAHMAAYLESTKDKVAAVNMHKVAPIDKVIHGSVNTSDA